MQKLGVLIDLQAFKKTKTYHSKGSLQRNGIFIVMRHLQTVLEFHFPF